MSKKTRAEERHDTMTTVAGITLRLAPISHVLMSELPGIVRREMEEEGLPLDPPKYQVRLAGGGVVEYDHDDKSVTQYPLERALEETDGDQKAAEKLVAQKIVEAQAAWKEHKGALTRFAEEVNRREMDFAIEDGVIWDGEIPDDWVARRKKRGFAVPDDPDDLRLYYIKCGVLIAARDTRDAFYHIMAMTAAGVDSALVAGALEFFRPKVEGEDTDPGITEPDQECGPLDEQPTGTGD